MSEKTPSSNFYAVSVTAGQEIGTALMIEERIRLNNITEVYSLVIPPQLKGYVIIEASGLHVVKAVIQGLRHVKKVVPGLVPLEEIKKYVSREEALPTLKVGDLVEIITGPFRGMQAKVVGVEPSKREVTLYILESSFPLQVTVPIEQVREVKR
ncbi:MAG: transcription elongation factor Spt5 [Sulfolobaceae archaeon]|nr:transcription elongation factor Spt5 [Sulfolobales archaeon]MCQ4384598.1 transcription elongation factor Spt5 [Sulfolobales archaeon]MCQ4406584.1 transcription elongation factor Spt5 [Sulfolobales archaeon]MCQ4449904.1 transcription elongation factor Spt5 [Sulfolobales archaeon]